MRRLLIKLQSSSAFWLLLFTSVIFFLLRLPSFFEPYWYGDEGIYEAIGLALSHGRLLYQGIWDNKPPLLYLLYGIFQGDQGAMKFLSFLTGMFAVWGIFFLSKKLFVKFQAAALVTVIFAILFGLPLLEGNIANSENFMLLPNILAALLVYTVGTKKQFARKTSRRDISILFAAGLILGVSFLFKVVALFDLVAFSTFLAFLVLPRFSVFDIFHAVKKVLPLLVGFILPLGSTMLYFSAQHIFATFLRSTFFSNIGYVNYGNQFLIPQGLLILKTALLAGVVLFILRKRQHMTPAILFTVLWLVFSIYNALFSQRPYTHYVLVLLPSFALLFGLCLVEKRWRKLIGLVIVALMLFVYTSFWTYKHTVAYYTNFISYALGQKSQMAYQSFFDQSVPRDYAIASYINSHRKPGQTVYAWGNSAQIYKLTNTLPAGRFVVAYHVQMSEQNTQDTEKVLAQYPPTYIIVLPNEGTLPFPLIRYQEKIIFDQAVIYEHIH